MNNDFFDAIRGGDAATVARLIDADPGLLKATDGSGLGAFTVARYSRQNEIAQMLLDRGVELDICAAAMAGNEERITTLLADRRTLAAEYSHDGWTPLHLAAFFGNNGCAKALIENGADVHARSRNAMNNTPLHAAAAGRHLDVIETLLEHGANVNARQNGGWTPLHSAAQNGDVDIAKLLLERGADRWSAADNQQTPFDLALTQGHQPMVELLDVDSEGAGT